MNINITQGETADLIFSAVNSNGQSVNLPGAKGVFAYRDYDNSEPVEKPCVVVEDKISVTLPSSETRALAGFYEYEVKIVDELGNVDTVAKGELLVAESIIPNYE